MDTLRRRPRERLVPYEGAPIVRVLPRRFVTSLVTLTRRETLCLGVGVASASAAWTVLFAWVC